MYINFSIVMANQHTGLLRPPIYVNRKGQLFFCQSQRPTNFYATRFKQGATLQEFLNFYLVLYHSIKVSCNTSCRILSCNAGVQQNVWKCPSVPEKFISQAHKYACKVIINEHFEKSIK